MDQHVEAIYQRGKLHLLKPLKGLKENSTVLVTVSSLGQHPLARFAGALSHEEADEMMRLIEAEFEKDEPNAW
jgi:predicted DNA-binding antitoxin AbrB/MazE fold protein